MARGWGSELLVEEMILELSGSNRVERVDSACTDPNDRLLKMRSQNVPSWPSFAATGARSSDLHVSGRQSRPRTSRLCTAIDRAPLLHLHVLFLSRLNQSEWSDVKKRNIGSTLEVRCLRVRSKAHLEKKFP